MPTLLVIEVSPRFDYSISRKLTNEFVEKWTAAHPGGAVVVRDLVKTNIPFVDLPWLGAAFTPPEQHSTEHAAAIKISNDLIAELKAATHIVIGTPMYNFSIPALLKAYVDQIVRFDATVSTTYEGLLTGKRATLIISTGGDFSSGAAFESYNQATGYIRLILGFIGITDINIVLAGQTLSVDKGETTMQEFVGKFDAQLSTTAGI